MAATNIRFYARVVAAFSSLLTKQLGICSATDADLGFKMLGYKDGDGTARQVLCKDQPVKVTTIDATEYVGSGDVLIGATKAVYIGSKTVDGSWRFIRDGNTLSIQRRESASWVEKSSIEA